MTSLLGAIIESDIKTYLDQSIGGNPWVNAQSLNTIIPALFNLGLIAATVILFFMLLTGGIKWITAGGDKEGVQKAQSTLTAAIIGIVIVLSAWAIKNLVWNFFGLSGATGGGAAGQYDCCQIIGGNMTNKYECCKLVDKYGCVKNRYQKDASTCSKLVIDWSCWGKIFTEKFNPDPSNFCKSN